MHEPGEPVRERDGDTGADHGALAWWNDHVRRGDQIGARVAGTGVGGHGNPGSSRVSNTSTLDTAAEITLTT